MSLFLLLTPLETKDKRKKSDDSGVNKHVFLSLGVVTNLDIRGLIIWADHH